MALRDAMMYTYLMYDNKNRKENIMKGIRFALAGLLLLLMLWVKLEDMRKAE
jgi:hypothetical protein